MLRKIKATIRSLLPAIVHVNWVKRKDGSKLKAFLPNKLIRSIKTSHSLTIKIATRDTNGLGPQPLWDGYEGNKDGVIEREPSAVKTSADLGDLYSNIVQYFKPENIVEFGTAFGVSGMYFLAGLESNQKGKLFTFEPNEAWRDVAIRNMERISDRFESVLGTFEENIDLILGDNQKIDLAFIDAIHTKEFVLPQLDLVIKNSSDGAIIILDDINFSESMKDCWKQVSQDERFISSVTVGRRIGILELACKR
ncbi:MAG: methyltransferase [Planctomycetota bacterium]|nr:MAG: methyltransferase [Planctomycetota bacterium]